MPGNTPACRLRKAGALRRHFPPCNGDGAMLRPLACALAVLAAAAQAQRTPASQDGQIAAGDTLRATIQGGYSRADYALGRGPHPTRIADNNALRLCIDSAATDGAHGALCRPDQTGGGVSELDSYVGRPGKKLDLQLHRAEYVVGDDTSIAGPDAAVPNNAALKNVQGNFSKHLRRLGFRAPGDGGAATYDWSAANCTAPDDGAQIQPSSGSGCWIADFSAARPVPEVWGAVGDGATDDAAAINTALAY